MYLYRYIYDKIHFHINYSIGINSIVLGTSTDYSLFPKKNILFFKAISEIVSLIALFDEKKQILIDSNNFWVCYFRAPQPRTGKEKGRLHTGPPGELATFIRARSPTITKLHSSYPKTGNQTRGVSLLTPGFVPPSK